MPKSILFVILLLVSACTVEARTWPHNATQSECAKACGPATPLYADECSSLPQAKAQRCQRNGARSLLKFCMAFGTTVCTAGVIPPEVRTCEGVTQRLVDLETAYDALWSLYMERVVSCPQSTTTTTSPGLLAPTTTIPASEGGGYNDFCDPVHPCQPRWRCKHPGVCKE